MIKHLASQRQKKVVWYTAYMLVLTKHV